VKQKSSRVARSLARDKSSQVLRPPPLALRRAQSYSAAFSRLGQWIWLQLYELGDKTFIGLLYF